MNLGAESAADTQSVRTVQVADGSRVSSEFTRASSEVDPSSEFRLAWLRVEGWRAQLRKGGDIVEKARWEWKVEDVMAAGRERRASIPDIVAGVPSSLRSMRGSVLGGGNRNYPALARSQAGSKKGVRWGDSA